MADFDSTGCGLRRAHGERRVFLGAATVLCMLGWASAVWAAVAYAVSGCLAVAGALAVWLGLRQTRVDRARDSLTDSRVVVEASWAPGVACCDSGVDGPEHGAVDRAAA